MLRKEIIMPEEKLLDSIQLIGDGIGAINHRLANTLPTEKGFNELEKERDAALDRLHFLVKLFTTNSTLRFVQANSELATVNADMKKILDDIQDLQDTIDTVTRFVSAIDKFIGAISQMV